MNPVLALNVTLKICVWPFSCSLENYITVVNIVLTSLSLYIFLQDAGLSGWGWGGSGNWFPFPYRLTSADSTIPTCCGWAVCLKGSESQELRERNLTSHNGFTQVVGAWCGVPGHWSCCSWPTPAIVCGRSAGAGSGRRLHWLWTSKSKHSEHWMVGWWGMVSWLTSPWLWDF